MRDEQKAARRVTVALGAGSDARSLRKHYDGALMKTIRLPVRLGLLALGLGVASTAAVALPPIPLERGPSLVSEASHKRDKHVHAEKKKLKKKAIKKHKLKKHSVKKKPAKKVVKKQRHVQKKDAKKL
jgi:hypothetical protein